MNIEKKEFEMPQIDVCSISISEAVSASYLCCTDGVDKNGSSCCEIA